MSNTQKIIDNTSYQDLASMSFGFPTEDEILDQAFNSFGGDGGSNDSRTSVNGAFKPLGKSEVEEGFDFVDDDFDNFLTKKSRERGRRRRELRKEGRDEGKSRKDARKDARRQAVEEIPPAKIFQNVGRAIKVGALALPRSAFLVMCRINWRGISYKLAKAFTDPKYANEKKKVKDKWNRLGGKWEKLIQNVNIGKVKKPFFCGKKCKKELLDKDFKRGFINFNSDIDFYNVAEPVSATATGVYVSMGLKIAGAIGSLISAIAIPITKSKEIKSAEKQAQNELDTLSKIEKDKIALAEKQLELATDPVTLIQNNPNLTPAQKRQAIRQTEEALGTSNKKIIKYAIMGGLVLVGLFIASKVLKNK